MFLAMFAALIGFVAGVWQRPNLERQWARIKAAWKGTK